MCSIFVRPVPYEKIDGPPPKTPDTPLSLEWASPPTDGRGGVGWLRVVAVCVGLARGGWLVGSVLVCAFVCAFVSAFVCSFRGLFASALSWVEILLFTPERPGTPTEATEQRSSGTLADRGEA